MKSRFLIATLLCLSTVCVLPGRAQAGAPAFSQIIVFGDSLSDAGNFADVTDDDYGVRYPSPAFNYADGRFTDSGETHPAALSHQGVWHEQLAQQFLGIAPAKASLDGGSDYAFGDAETLDGQRDVVLEQGLSIEVDHLNQQVTNYLDAHAAAADPAALCIVWGGANDLFADRSAANVTAAAQRETAIIQRLAAAGATTFLVPNLPPLGLTPVYSGNATEAAALTQAASDFRDRLNADLDALEASFAAEGLPVTIHRLDIFDLFNRLTADGGAASGFTNVTASAQGADVQADQYLFWDDVHPTAAGHYQIASAAYALLSGGTTVPPAVTVAVKGSGVAVEGGAAGKVTLARTGDTSAALTVSYKVGGSAKPGVDYQPLTGTAVIPAGAAKVKIKVKAIDNATVDGARAVKIKLLQFAGGSYLLDGPATAKIKVIDND